MRKLIKNPYIFSILSKVIITVLGFLFTVLQSRYLGAAIKGEVAYIASVTSVTAIIFGSGIHQAYPYYKAKTQENLRPIFLRIALLFLFTYTVISVVISLCFVKDERWIAILLITPLMVYNRIVTYLTMVETPNRKHATEMLVNVIELVVIVLLYLFFPASFFIGVILVLIKDLLLTITYSWHWRKEFLLPCHVTRRQIVELMRFGFLPMLALLMTTLNYRVDIIMLGGFVSNAEIGIYSVGVMLAERVWMIPDAMKDVMVSNLAKGKGVDEVSFVIRVCNTVCLVIVMIIILLGEPFINLVFGEEFRGAYQITVLILIGVFFMIYYKMIASYNIVIGKQFFNFLFLGISVICNIGVNWLLIPQYGNQGAALASLLSYGICALLFLGYFIRKTSTPLSQLLLITRGDFDRLYKRIKKSNRGDE